MQKSSRTKHPRRVDWIDDVWHAYPLRPGIPTTQGSLENWTGVCINGCFKMGRHSHSTEPVPNGAHPYENPTPLTNLLEMLAIAVLPAALTHTFGRMIGRPRDGWILFGIMVVLFAAGLAVCDWAEQAGNPRLGLAGTVDQSRTDLQPGGNMEGKETRFGI